MYQFIPEYREYRDIETNLMLYLLKQMQKLAHKNTRNDINQLDLLHFKTNLLKPHAKNCTEKQQHIQTHG